MERQALLALELGCFPLLPKWRPFAALDRTAQDGVLGDLMSSGVDLKRAIFGGGTAAIAEAMADLDPGGADPPRSSD